MKDETHDRPAADRPDAEDRYYFEHERLDCYQLATEVAAWLGKHLPEDRDLRQQARRASHSIVLNIAEGCGRKGRSRKHHYSIARGSAAELSTPGVLLRRQACSGRAHSTSCLPTRRRSSASCGASG